MLQLTYHANFLFGWLESHERVGLDVAATKKRFEQKISIVIASHNQEITFKYLDAPMDRYDEEYCDFWIDTDQLDPEEERQLIRFILRATDDLLWLAFKTPQDHIDALLCYQQRWKEEIRPNVPAEYHIPEPPNIVDELVAVYNLDFISAEALLHDAVAFWR